MDHFDFQVIDKILNQEQKYGHKRRIDPVDEPNKKMCLTEVDVNSMDRVEKRNARERNRVKLVNNEFENLRQIILNSEFCRDMVNNGWDTSSNDESNCSIKSLYSKRVSKLKILKTAIEYINYLSDFLELDADFTDIDLSCLQASSPLVDNFFMKLNTNNNLLTCGQRLVGAHNKRFKNTHPHLSKSLVPFIRRRDCVAFQLLTTLLSYEKSNIQTFLYISQITLSKLLKKNN
ncbi:hypothetical protein BpHYR1_043332 [Brachionus plicatilis]|uniref:BHLH domain-containing protein n=1 Tax=Brachionus plicatilis TaxID=10195 RepID=A0A3M7QIT5_BRAPC|nr:hypothetical protein BpHYR1_043332 [Brachionus plicatilis]